jgi:hypothetical protein
MSALLKVVDADVRKMDDSIAMNNDISSSEAKDITANIREYMRSGSNQVLTELTEKLNEKPRLRDLIFPTKFKQEYDKLKTTELQIAMKGRAEMLEAVLNLQLSMAKQMSERIITYNIHRWEEQIRIQGIEIEKRLAILSMQTHTELTAFSQQKFMEMKNHFDESKKGFAEKQDALFSDCDKYKHIPSLHARYKQNLEYEIDVFFGMTEKLLAGFQDALEKKLSDYKAT